MKLFRMTFSVQLHSLHCLQLSKNDEDDDDYDDVVLRYIYIGLILIMDHKKPPPLLLEGPVSEAKRAWRFLP